MGGASGVIGAKNDGLRVIGYSPVSAQIVGM